MPFAICPDYFKPSLVEIHCEGDWNEVGRGGGTRRLAVWKKTRRFDVCKETQKLAFTMKLVDSPFGRKPMDPQFERKLEDLLFVKIWNSLRG